MVPSIIDTRFHQSIAREPFRLGVFGEDEQLAKQFLFYCCYKMDTDIFGFRRIDPKDFVKEMKYKTMSNFQKKLAEPYQLKGKTPKQIEELRSDPNVFIFENRFENMLYKLHKIDIELQDRDDSDPDNYRFILRSERLLEEVHVFQDKNNKNKKYYNVKFSAYFVQKLSQNFLLLSKESFSTLALKGRTNKIQDLYLRIGLRKESLKLKGISSYEEDFDGLCECLGIDHYSTPSKKKQKLTEYFNILKEVATDLKVELHWIKKGNHFFGPVVCFSDNEPFSKNERYKLRKQIFNSLLNLTLTSVFSTLHPKYFNQNARHYFEKWMNNPAADVSEKEQAYCEAHLMCFNKDIEPSHKAVSHYINYRKHLNDF